MSQIMTRHETRASAAPTVPAGLPLVSVVVPTRGRPDLVRETIAAIAAQTYGGPLECIVVHDQEEPDPALSELGVRTRQVEPIANTGTPGLAGARNCGMARARGELIASCDDDDVWHPTKLEKQVQLLMTDPELVAVGSGLRLLFPGRSVDWPARADVIDPELLLRSRVKELHSSTLVMRREAAEKAGRYDEELPNGNGEDYDWVLRLSAVGKLGCVVEPLADIRKDAQSWYQGDEKALTKAEALVMFLSKHPEIESSRRGHARVLSQIAWAYSNAGERRTAARYASRSLRRSYRAPIAYLALLQIVTRVPASRVLRITRRFGRGIT
jgi:hypothetical protein